jgi:exosome complex RNA-binding protein Rrp42 (RNase PH superfamily)
MSNYLAKESFPSFISHSGHISSSSSSSAVSAFAFYMLPKYSKNSSKDKDPSELVSNARQHLKISSY